MYLQILTTAMASHQTAAAAYVASERAKEIGIYVLALNHATDVFFRSLEPPEDSIEVHNAFLTWHRRGMEALAEELGDGAGQAEAARLHVEAALALERALGNLQKSTQT